MDAVNDINETLDSLGFAQLLLAFAFLMSYALALSGLLGAATSRRAWPVAAAAAVGFSALTSPWFHGALLMALAVVGLGLFIATVWLVGALLGQVRERRARGAQPDTGSESQLTFHTTLPAMRHDDIAAGSGERRAVERGGRQASPAAGPGVLE